MPIAQILDSQRDFSSGELDTQIKRRDDLPIMKAGGRQMANWRVLNSGVIQQRPGRSALFIQKAPSRVEEFQAAPGLVFRLCFGGDGSFIIRDINGAIQAQQFGYLWTSTTLQNIVWTTVKVDVDTLDVVVCFPGSTVSTARYQNAAWTFPTFAFAADNLGVALVPFYRIAAPGATMTLDVTAAPGAVVNITTSAAVFLASHVGTQFRFANARIKITAVGSPTTAVGVAIDQILPTQHLTLASNAGVAIGQEVEGSVTSCKGVVVGIANAIETCTVGGSITAGDVCSIIFTTTALLGSPINFAYTVVASDTTDTIAGALATLISANAAVRAANITVSSVGSVITITQPANLSPAIAFSENVTGSATETLTLAAPASAVVDVQVTNFATGFSTSDTLIGPSSSAAISGVANVTPLPCVVWDEQMISAARGWPQSCNADRGRLIFCDLPSSPEAVLESGLSSPYNFSVGTGLGSDAIVELMAGKPRVYHIGAWYDQIVFTDKGIWYIPIGITNTLAPGQVNFLPVSQEASNQVRPAFTSEGFVYVNAGGNRLNAIIGTGAAYSTRPYVLQDVTTYHTHLFAAGPINIAVANGDGTFPERYVYVTMADGSVNVGRYEPGKDFTIGMGVSPTRWVGWVPWSVGVETGRINWVSSLRADIIFCTSYGSTAVVETLDDSKFVDGSILVNSPPAQMTPGAGQGPFYWLPYGSVVSLVDGQTSLGSYSIDFNGNLIPVTNAEDWSSPTLTGGIAYQPLFEPFVPNIEPGQDNKQRMKRRRIPRMAATVENSTGFLFAKLYSGPLGALLPATGTVMGERRVNAWNQDDNQDGPPVPLREQTYIYRPTGRAYDPRVAIIKDTPGPIRIVEVGLEAGV